MAGFSGLASPALMAGFHKLPLGMPFGSLPPLGMTNPMLGLAGFMPGLPTSSLPQEFDCKNDTSPNKKDKSDSKSSSSTTTPHPSFPNLMYNPLMFNPLLAAQAQHLGFSLPTSLPTSFASLAAQSAMVNGQGGDSDLEEGEIKRYPSKLQQDMAQDLSVKKSSGAQPPKRRREEKQQLSRSKILLDQEQPCDLSMKSKPKEHAVYKEREHRKEPHREHGKLVHKEHHKIPHREVREHSKESHHREHVRESHHKEHVRESHHKEHVRDSHHGRESHHREHDRDSHHREQGRESHSKDQHHTEGHRVYSKDLHRDQHKDLTLPPSQKDSKDYTKVKTKIQSSFKLSKIVDSLKDKVKKMEDKGKGRRSKLDSIVGKLGSSADIEEEAESSTAGHEDEEAASVDNLSSDGTGPQLTVAELVEATPEGSEIVASDAEDNDVSTGVVEETEEDGL